MAQLRSFRYLGEPDDTLQQNNNNTTEDDSSSSSNNDSLGEGGGNLTSGSSNRSTARVAAGVAGSQRPAATVTTAVGEQASSLDSNEELQATYHDIIEEDEEETPPSGRNEPQQVPDSAAANSSGSSNNNNSNNNWPRTRLSSIGEFNQSRMPLRQQVLIGRQQLTSNTTTTTNKPESLKLDTLSQSSETRNFKPASPISPMATTNHFEIRWRNVHLYSKKSRLPEFLKQNRVWSRLFRGSSGSSTLGKHEEASWPTPALISKRIHLNSSGLSVSNPSSPIVGCRVNKLGSPLDALSGHNISQNMNDQQQQQTEFCQSEYRSILRNINGAVFSGQLTAVLGPSGVGKTSLLNSLTGRNTLAGTGRVSLIGGASKRMAVVTVPQVDVLPGKLTVLEDLRFTSRLKNPQRNFDHKRNIDRIVCHLHMEKFLKTKIDRLSGGEARRLSIGRELLSSPDIMILDEPTSGLDANTCKKIIAALRDIVEHSDHILDRPMSIIVTIHQPQQEVLNLFHRVYVMAQGGRAIYEGPPGSMLNTMLEFSSLSKITNVDDLNENPAIVALEVASGEYGPEIISELALYQESQWLFCDEQQQQHHQQVPVQQVESPSWLHSSPFSTPGLAFKWPGKKTGAGGSQRLVNLNSPQVPLRRPHESPKLRADWTPRSLRKMPASPTSLHRHQQHQHQQYQNNFNHNHNNQGLAPPMPFDRLSNVTSVSFASSYDPYLPEQTTKLKVDKRLRRSVVMKGDFVSQTWTLMQRAWLLSTRDLVLMSIRLVGFVLIALGMAQIFGPSLDPNEHQCPIYESEISDIPGYMKLARDRLVGLKDSIVQAGSTHLFFFHLMLSISMVTSALTGLIFPFQMRMLLREHKNGWYNLSSSVMSLTLAELPIDIFAPLLCMIITYPLCHQPESPYYWREIGYCLVITICCLICKSHAQIVGAVLMDSVENSVFAACVMISPPALLSGLAVRISSMSWILEMTSYTSYMRYTFENLLILRYGYGICPCDPEIIYGYPMKLSHDAIPSHLDGIARGFLESLQSTTTVATISGINATVVDVANSTSNNLLVTPTTSENNSNNLLDSNELTASNLFLSFVRLMTDSSNKFAPKMSDLGNCNSYRSLYLMDMGIDDHSFTTWMFILVAMFILSRFITYFTIRAVIKLRHA